MVVSVKEKTDLGFCQVGARETNESEPLTKRRKSRDGVKTGVFSRFRDKSGGNLLTARAASGVQAA